MRRAETEGQVFRALQGHKIVAGGNAPGCATFVPRPWRGRITLSRGMPSGFDPFRVGTCWGRVFRGRCPRVLYRSPPGIKGGQCRGRSRPQEAGKTPFGPLGLNCSTETRDSSSFWRGDLWPRSRKSYTGPNGDGLQQAAGKRFTGVILSEAKNLARRIFMNIRDSSSPPAPQNDSAYQFFRSLLDLQRLGNESDGWR